MRADPQAKEIIVKELDHIQAILGRYDAFFFLMKQVCLAVIGGGFTLVVSTAHDNNHIVRAAPFIAIVPIVFLIMEYCFRLLYWTGYVARLKTVQKYLRGGDASEIVLYVIKEKDKARWCNAFKWFDCIFYLTWLVVALAAGCWISSLCEF